MSRFLGYQTSGIVKNDVVRAASASAYIERVSRRFGLEDTRTHESVFEISESDFVEDPTEKDHSEGDHTVKITNWKYRVRGG
jgi:hypothetical protein